MSKNVLDTSRIAVTDENQENTIYIKSKFDFGTKMRFSDDLNLLAARNNISPSAAEKLLPGQTMLLILKHFVVGWEGPSFEGLTFSEKNIERLADFNEALAGQAMERIGATMKPSESVADPKNSNGGGD